MMHNWDISSSAAGDNRRHACDLIKQPKYITEIALLVFDLINVSSLEVPLKMANVTRT